MHSAHPATSPLAVPRTVREDRLPRQLGIWSAAAASVGLTIGSGIFRVPSIVIAETGSVGAAALCWILGGIITLCGALTIAELAAAFPRAGSLYVYLREAYGPMTAFLFGWSWIFIRAAASAGTALVFAGYLRTFIPLDDSQQRVAAVLVILVVGAANYRSLRLGALIQNASTVAKVAALLILSGVIFAFGDGSAGALADPLDFRVTDIGGFGVGLIAALFAFDGWQAATFMGGEIRDPGRVLPRALVSATLVIITVYLVANAAYMYALPLDAAAVSTTIAVDAMTVAVGAGGAAAIAALVLLSTFGGLNAGLLTGSRVYYAMAEDKLFFRAVAAVHPRYQTPHVAVAMLGVLSAISASVRTFEQLAETFVLLFYPFIALSVAAVFILRRTRPELVRPYRTWGYPVIPAIFLIGTLAMLGNAVVQRTDAVLLSLAIVAVGVPAYFIWRRK